MQEALELDDTMDLVPRDLIEQALALMYRERPVRRAPAKTISITNGVRREIMRLARTRMTMNEIARVTGVRNQGRVSEVLNGKR
jgi:hypothetical protein